MRDLELKVPPLLLFVVLAVALVASGRHDLVFSGYGIVGMLGLGLSAVCCLLGVYHFRQARTTVDPLHPQRASQLVQHGVYRWSRNPMYLAFAMALGSLALIVQSWQGVLDMIVFIAYITRFQIYPEERALQQQFGLHYQQYCQKVPRWLVW